jgi:hypothetical protein
MEIGQTVDKILARTPISGANSNRNLLIQSTIMLAFIACEDKLMVIGLHSKQVALKFQVNGNPGMFAYDAGLGLEYLDTEFGVLYHFKASI